MSNAYSMTDKRLPAAMIGLAMVFAPAVVFAANPPAAHDHTMVESQEPVSDSWITTKVKADLLTTKNVPGTEVKVETVNGVVTLSGTVATATERERAIAIATGIKGVSNVEASDLKVGAAQE